MHVCKKNEITFATMITYMEYYVQLNKSSTQKLLKYLRKLLYVVGIDQELLWENYVGVCY